MSAMFQFLAHRLVRQLLKCTIELLLPCFVGDRLLVVIDDFESQVKHVNIRINRKDIGCFTFEIKENDNSHSYSSPVYCKNHEIFHTCYPLWSQRTYLAINWVV